MNTEVSDEIEKKDETTEFNFEENDDQNHENIFSDFFLVSNSRLESCLYLFFLFCNFFYFQIFLL